MEGICDAHCTTGSNQGDGLAVLRSGEILGGNPQNTCKASSHENGQFLYANVRVSPYAGSGLSADPQHHTRRLVHPFARRIAHADKVLSIPNERMGPMFRRPDEEGLHAGSRSK
jgi:hypothetical protein